jgi:hypothetical protein
MPSGQDDAEADRSGVADEFGRRQAMLTAQLPQPCPVDDREPAWAAQVVLNAPTTAGFISLAKTW